MSGTHALFAPSASHRWLHCPASLLPHAALPDDTSEPAAHGTILHGISEEWLNLGECPAKIGDVYECEGFSLTITQQHINWCESYVDWCNELPGEHFVELRVDLTDYFPPVYPRDEFDQIIEGSAPVPQGGTSDHVAVHKHTLTITDAKFGGHEVEAEDNTQELLYALGAYHKLKDRYDIREVVLRIAQPRLHNFPVWKLTVEKLLAFGEYVRERAKLAFVKRPPYGPSEHACRFCKLKPCRAQQEFTQRLVEGAFGDLDEPQWTSDDMKDREYPMGPADITTMTLEQVETVLRNKPMVESFLKACEDLAFKTLHEGKPFPGGWKLVESRSNRVWIDQDTAYRILRSEGADELDLYSIKLLSPAQAEDLLPRKKQKMLAPFIKKPPGKPTLAQANDKRSAYTTPVSAFDDLDADEW